MGDSSVFLFWSSPSISSQLSSHGLSQHTITQTFSPNIIFRSSVKDWRKGKPPLASNNCAWVLGPLDMSDTSLVVRSGPNCLPTLFFAG